jgi:hypothetical protein
MKNRFTSLFRPTLVLGLCLFAGGAWAQATRTWVSGVGDDANPCSRTAPCKTFAGAISKTAAKGVISVLDPGGFGGVTITKSITIDGGGREGSILSAGSNGIVVNAGANDVIRIKNIAIDGAGTGLNGVRFIAGGALLLDNVAIHDHTGQGVWFAPTASSRLSISNSAISNNTGAGVLVQAGGAGLATVAIANSRLLDNGSGVNAEDRSTVSIRSSDLSNNRNTGVKATSAGQAVEVTLDGCQVVNNGLGNSSSAGIKAKGALASILIADNTITGNYNGVVAVDGADIVSFGSNRLGGNTVDGAPSGTLQTR